MRGIAACVRSLELSFSSLKPHVIALNMQWNGGTGDVNCAIYSGASWPDRERRRRRWSKPCLAPALDMGSAPAAERVGLLQTCAHAEYQAILGVWTCLANGAACSGAVQVRQRPQQVTPGRRRVSHGMHDSPLAPGCWHSTAACTDVTYIKIRASIEGLCRDCMHVRVFCGCSRARWRSLEVRARWHSKRQHVFGAAHMLEQL